MHGFKKLKKLLRKATAVISAVAIAVCITACGSSSSADYSNSTVVGQVTAIDGTVVTLQIGELSDDSSQPPDMPDAGENSDSSAEENGAQNDNGDSQTPPEKPSGDSSQAPADAGGTDSSGSSGQTPPEKPSGDSSQAPADAGGTDSSGSSGQTPPEKPSGDSSQAPADAGGTDSSGSSGQNDGQTPPDMPENSDGTEGGGNAPGGGGSLGGQTFTAGDDTASFDLDGITIIKNGEEITVSDISEGDVISIEVGDDNTPESATIENVSSGFGGSGEVNQGSAATSVTTDTTLTDETFSSSGDDENALRIDGAEVTLENITVEKTAGSSSNTEDGDFYGMNAALLATNGAQVTIKNAEVKSSAQNGNGIFSYGSGTTVNVSDTTITTTADNSGGIQTTGGASMNASNLTVTTSGSSSAAIRSDRGGGTVKVNGGTYTSNGYNSPAVYSTADITVSDAVLTASNSEALVIEGENSITLSDCDVTGNMSDTKGASSDENVHNVMIYQSMSGDAEEGTSSFSMTGGSLTSNNGDMFYITNTDCTVTLSDVSIVNKDSSAYLMLVSGNSASHGWGNAGSNGASVTFTADNQVLSGNIAVDAISSLTMSLKNGSSFTGTLNIIDNAAGGTSDSSGIFLTIDEGSTLTLTGNCTVGTLENNGTINFNGYTITLADGTVLSE